MAKEQLCGGSAPMESVTSFMGMKIDYKLADRVCCRNEDVYATEPSGYHATDASVCSRDWIRTTRPCSTIRCAVFVAPRGRTFEEFKDQSVRHGWPSFRPKEIVSENVILHDGGRLESKCGTRLGRNLPDGDRDRYSVNLLCVSSVASLEWNEIVFDRDDGTTTDNLSAIDFDQSTYRSSAKE